MTDLAKLNRLRVNAGKPELKAWKASGAKLAEAIKTLEDAGFIDALPGANIKAEPVTDDPELAKTQAPPEPKPEPEVKKQKAQLARGLETDSMARQSRVAVQMARERERREATAEKQASKEEAKAAKKAAKKDKPKGEVDPKKDPEKAARQKQHIKDKQKAREGKPPKTKAGKDEITVADIARALDIDPKVARAKLRRHESKIEKFHTKGQDRWVFPKSAEKEIIKILK